MSRSIHYSISLPWLVDENRNRMTQSRSQKQNSTRRSVDQSGMTERRRNHIRFGRANTVMQDRHSAHSNQLDSISPKEQSNRPGKGAKFKLRTAATCVKPITMSSSSVSADGPLACFARATLETLNQPTSQIDCPNSQGFIGDSRDNRLPHDQWQTYHGAGERKAICVGGQVGKQAQQINRKVTGSPRQKIPRWMTNSTSLSEDEESVSIGSQGHHIIRQIQESGQTLVQPDKHDIERGRRTDYNAASDILDCILGQYNMSADQRSCVKLTLGQQVIACATAAATAMSLVKGASSCTSQAEKTPGTAVTIVDELSTSGPMSPSASSGLKADRFVFDYSVVAVETSDAGKDPDKHPRLDTPQEDAGRQSAILLNVDTGSEHSRLFASLNLSVERIKTMVERNLVATLIGLYILISLTVIFALTLPYFTSPHRLPLSFDEVIENWPRFDEPLQALAKQPKDSGKGAELLSVRPSSVHTPEHTHLLEDKNMLVSPSRLINQTVSGDRQAVVDKQLVANYTMQDQAEISSKRLRTGASDSASPVNRAYHELWDVIYDQPCQRLRIPFCSKSFHTLASSSNLPSVVVQGRSSLSTSAKSLAQPASYDKTLLPNQFTQAKQAQIERALQRYEPIVDIRCYALMPLFLCSILAPKCVPSNSSSNLTGLRSTSPQVSARELLEPDARSMNNRQIKKTAGWLSNVPPSSPKTDYSSWSRLVPPCRSLCIGKRYLSAFYCNSSCDSNTYANVEAFRKCTFFFEVLSLKLLDPKECELLPQSTDPDVCIGHAEHEALRQSTGDQG